MSTYNTPRVWTKEFRVDYHREYRRKNKKKMKKQRKRYWKNNKYRFTEKGKKYYTDNKERLRIYWQRYYLSNEKVVYIKTVKQSSKCVRCSESDPSCLDFHHRDKETKKFNIGMYVLKYSLQEIKDEIAKCDILCSNCHRKLHAQYKVLNIGG